MSRYIKHGRIYQATEDFFAQEANRIKDRPAFYKVKKGEKLEFRYECDVHFRTVDNIYMFVKQKEFEEKTKPYGDIWHNVIFRNQNKLKGILSECLYDEIETQKVEG